MSEMTKAEKFFDLFTGHVLAGLADITPEQLAATFDEAFDEVKEDDQIVGQLLPRETHLLILLEDLRLRFNHLADECNVAKDHDWRATIDAACHVARKEYEMIQNLFWSSLRLRMKRDDITIRRGGQVVAMPEERHFGINLLLGGGPFGGMFPFNMSELFGNRVNHPIAQMCGCDCSACPARNDCHLP